MRIDATGRPTPWYLVAGRIFVLGAIWTFTAGATSCSVGGDDGEFGGPTFVTDLTLRNSAGTVASEFSPGETITLELTVRNRSDLEAVLEFTSGQQSDFVVLDSGTTRVRWKWSHGKAFTQATTDLVFAPDQTRTITVQWDQRDNDGLAIAPGNYEARGVLIFGRFASDPLFPHQLGSPLRRFTIR